MAFWDLIFSWIPQDMRITLYTFLFFAFIIALVKFVKR